MWKKKYRVEVMKERFLDDNKEKQEREALFVSEHGWKKRKGMISTYGDFNSSEQWGIIAMFMKSWGETIKDENADAMYL